MSLTQTEPRGSNDSTVHETAWTSDALADAIALKAVAPIQSPRAAATVAPTALSAQPPTPVRHDSQAPILRRSDTSSIPETGAERESGLQPVDGGPGAYRFLIASGMFELVCWGQSYVSRNEEKSAGECVLIRATPIRRMVLTNRTTSITQLRRCTAALVQQQ